MSFKSKNLAVNHEDPPFLKKLKGGFDEDAETKTRQHARPVKRLLDADDDEPTYVDPASNTVLSKAEAEMILGGGNEDDASGTESAPQPAKDDGSNAEAENLKKAKEQAFSKIGSTGKRKLGKVVGEDEDDAVSSGPQSRPVKKKSVKKSKVKLSFEDE